MKALFSNFRLGVLCALLIGMFGFSHAQRNRAVRIDCSEAPIRVNYDISGFHGIDTRSIIDVVLVPSEKEKVEVEMTPDYQEILKVEKKGGVLCFSLRPGETKHVMPSGECHLTAYVHFVNLQSVSASDAADVFMKGVYDAGGGPFTIHLSGASDMQGSLSGIGNLNMQTSGASDMEINLNQVSALKYLASGACDIRGSWTNIGQAIMDCSGSCDCTIEGNAESLNMRTSGASEVRMEGFSVARFVGSSSGASSLRIHVTDSFRGESSGSSDILVTGSPKATEISTSGSSKIKIR